MLDLIERTGAIAGGATIIVRLDADDLDHGTELVSAWCAQTGNELLQARLPSPGWPPIRSPGPRW